MGQARGAVVERGDRVDGRVREALGVGETVLGDARAGGGGAAGEEEAEPGVLARPLGARRDVRHELEHGRDVAVEGAAAEGDVHAGRDGRVEGLLHVDAGADAPRLQLLLLRKRLVVHLLRAELGDVVGEEVEVGDEPVGQVGYVEEQVGERDAVRGLRVNLKVEPAGGLGQLRVPALDLPRNRLAHLERGEDVGVLVAVLARAQRHRLLDDLILLLVSQGLFNLGNLLLLRLLELGVVVLVGDAHDGDLVRVIEEPALDELLPVLGIGVDRSLELGGEYRDLEGLHAVAAVHPRAHRAKRHAEAKVGAHLRRAELNLVHDRVDALRREALLRDPLQGGLDLGLHVRHVRLRDTLEAHREGRLPPGRGVPGAGGETRAEPGLEQRLVEVRLRSVEEQVGRDGEGEVLELRLLLLDLVDHEVRDGDHALFVLVGNHGIRGD